MSAWVLPYHIADVLPAQARLIEDYRRTLLDTARSYGYELVMPPLVEHIDSLLSGTGEALDLQTFKMVDLLSGRTLGVRADTTQQVARIDAHLLNREGVARLCYCGPVLHTRPEQPHATREPLQFGAEIYGCSGSGAELEILSLALDSLKCAHTPTERGLVADLADARIVPALLQQAPDANVDIDRLQTALISKNADALELAAQALPGAVRQQLHALLGLYGDVSVIRKARNALPALPQISQALDELQWLCEHIQRTHPDITLLIDLADAAGYAYYSGVRFALYLRGCSEALVRGGRYDEVGAVFGRNRPAVGFSLDVKALANLSTPSARPAAIAAEWREALDWRQTVRALRAGGETVIVSFPGQGVEEDTACCDRKLVEQDGQWVVQPVSAA